MSPSDSDPCRLHSLARPAERCTNKLEWELLTDREVHEMSEDQLAYLDKSIEVEMEERGWIREGDGWRLDV